MVRTGDQPGVAPRVRPVVRARGGLAAAPVRQSLGVSRRPGGPADTGRHLRAEDPWARGHGEAPRRRPGHGAPELLAPGCRRQRAARGIPPSDGFGLAYEPPIRYFPVPPAVGPQPPQSVTIHDYLTDALVGTASARFDVLEDVTLVVPAGSFHAYGVGQVAVPGTPDFASG